MTSRIRFRPILLTIATLFALGGSASRAAAVTICVPNSFDGSCDSSAATIQLAINAANIGGGDTVLVDNGLYVEAPVIDRQLTLQAFNPATEADAGNSAAQAIIDGGGAETTLLVSSGVDGVVIDGFEITNPSHATNGTSPAGIRAQTDSLGGTTVTITITNNVIHEVADPGRTVSPFGTGGIQLFNVGNASLISGNTIYDLADSVPPAPVGESPGSGRNQAILVKSSNGTASGIVIDGNTIHDVLDVGIRFNGIGAAVTCDVSNNVIYSLGSPGTGFLSGLAIDHIGLGTVSANQIAGITGGLGVGIQASGASTVTGNSITGAAGGNIAFPGGAILTNLSGTTVTDNYLFGNAIGVTVAEPFAGAVSGVTVDGNCIAGNAAGLVDAITGSVDAENNWWGAPDGPSEGGGTGATGSGDTITNTAGAAPDFTPFAVVSLCAACSNDLYVDDSGSDAGNFCLISGSPCETIQHAVDVACPGATVNVAAGSYDEQVSIDKDLTVIGAGAGSAIVEPSAVAANTTSLTSAAAIAAIILVHSDADVSIEGLTVDGAPAAFNACAPGYMGVYFRNASGSLSDSHVTNIFHPSAAGCQSVVGVFVQSGGAGSATVTIEDNDIDGYGKNGVTCNEAASTCTIDGNTVTGRGPVLLGDAAQNGVQMGFGAGGSIVGNTIEDNYYSPMTFCSAGVLVNGSDGVDVLSNTLDGNLCDLLADTDGSTIAGNNIPSAGEYPFSILGDGNLMDKNLIDGSVYDGVYNDGINNTYTCNRVVNNALNGLYFDDFSGDGTPNTVNQNVIDGNGTGLDATAIVVIPPIDAQNNYWGCATGANTGSCDTAIGNVDFTPSVASTPLCVTCTGAGGDLDNDGVCDPVDNCVSIVNPGQANADGDALGDACDTCPNDPNNDVDGDTVCGDVDNCPDDVNLDQADTDGDGEGDVCDTNDGEGTLVLSRVVVRADGTSSPVTGKVRVNALIADDTTGNFLPGNLTVDGDVSLELTAGLFTATINFGTCTQQNSKKISCRNGDVKATFRLVPQRGNVFPNTWKMKAALNGAADQDTPTGPVTVLLIQPTPSIDRDDDISSCTARPGRVTCREQG
jgi:hypothetical protein